jgi:hypothetical protein
MSCQHAATGFPEEIYYVPEENEEEATVWCANCEAARIKDKGWFDYADSIADWKIICALCFDDVVKNSKCSHEIEGVRTPDE